MVKNLRENPVPKGNPEILSCAMLTFPKTYVRPAFQVQYNMCVCVCTHTV